ncbi:hypothetical protein CK203_102995 [Vitis vinifera]|uniref:PAP/OAS1 substrate-binding-related domain-containing protein n=1 Tax=Vitis vinifera TaxID=29760 RepID=A0A438CIX4_VITVI|nr:hypothetical protein CK203_102995 [Vitis vinifera]
MTTCATPMVIMAWAWQLGRHLMLTYVTKMGNWLVHGVDGGEYGMGDKLKQPRFLLLHGFQISSHLLPFNTLIHIITIKISSSNYLLWKSQLLPLLESQDLLGYVDGTLVPPPCFEPTTSTTLNTKYLTWKAADQFFLFFTLVFLAMETMNIPRKRLHAVAAREEKMDLRRGFSEMENLLHSRVLLIEIKILPKDYVQEFMAEAVSFLLRNAPVEQLIKGVRKIMLEAVKKPLLMRKSGVSALFYYAMRGTSSRFHSRAEKVLWLLMDSSLVEIDDEFTQDGDIDLTVLCSSNVEEALASDVHAVLKGERQNENAEFEVKNVQFNIIAEVKPVKCLVKDIVIDISFNQLGGLSTLCFLKQVDRLIGKDHLFKRSIILIKSRCYYESRILGAYHGLISTYALEILVLYIFHLFHSSLDGPLAVGYRFLDYFSKFDWDNYCISLNGSVCKSSLPDIVAELPENGDKITRIDDETASMGVLSSPSLSKMDSSIDGNAVSGYCLTRGLQRECKLWFSCLKIIEDMSDTLPPTGNLGRSLSVKSHHGHRLYFPSLFIENGKESKENHFVANTSFSSHSYHEGHNSIGSIISKPIANISENTALAFRGRDFACNVGSLRSLEILLDLNGDYDSHIRSLQYGQCCYGHALPPPLLPSPPLSPSQLQINTPWDKVHQHLQFKRNLYSQMDSNGVILGNHFL